MCIFLWILIIIIIIIKYHCNLIYINVSVTNALMSHVASTVLYIITIIWISLFYIVYNILLTSLLSRILIMKAISVPVWDYWHAAYSYVFICLYIVKVNTFIIIHVHVCTYYIEKCNSYMSTFYRYVFMSKLLYFHYMSHIYRNIILTLGYI